VQNISAVYEAAFAAMPLVLVGYCYQHAALTSVVMYVLLHFVTPTMNVKHKHTWPINHAMVSSLGLKIAMASMEVRPSSKFGVCFTCLSAVAKLGLAELSLAMQVLLGKLEHSWSCVPG